MATQESDYLDQLIAEFGIHNALRICTILTGGSRYCQAVMMPPPHLLPGIVTRKARGKTEQRYRHGLRVVNGGAG